MRLMPIRRVRSRPRGQRLSPRFTLVGRVIVMLIVIGLAPSQLRAQFPPPAVDARAVVTPEWLSPYRDAASRLIGAALESDAAWQRLAYISDTFGNRLSGSPNLEAAIKWAVDEMKKDGLENVHAEPVMVPHWVRGHESLEIVGDTPQPLVMLGLGNSVGTPATGVEAELLVVHNFEELDAQRDRVKGRIVLFNVPFTTYGETVRYPDVGPVARGGAWRGRRSSSVRLGRPAFGHLTPARLQYADGQPQIPAAAVAVEDAARLQRMVDRGTHGAAQAGHGAHISFPTHNPPTSSASCAAASGPTRSW